jgi:hypothetical protein
MSDGGHSHGGGGGGSHSHGGSSVAAPGGLIGGAVFATALVLGIEAVGWVGQHVYEATHPVHIVLVAGDWGSLFINVGLAVLLGAFGALLLIGGAIGRSLVLLLVGCVSLAVAGLCGLVLAPHFEAKVIERSPTDPSKLRPPAAIRRMVPARVTLRCMDHCQHGRVEAASSVSLRVSGMSIAVYKRLCGAGYADEWTSRNRPLMSSDEQTTDEAYSSSCLDYSAHNPYGKEIEALAKVPNRPGPWKITWRLRDPTGTVVRSATYRVVVKHAGA